MFNKITLLFASLTIFLLFGLSTTPAFAQQGVCLDKKNGVQGIDTAIGCIPLNDSGSTSAATLFTAFVLEWGLGISGGIALVIMGYAGIQLSMAEGDPQKIENAKALFTAAISGVVLIIFSTFALGLVGVDILGITGII